MAQNGQVTGFLISASLALFGGFSLFIVLKLRSDSLLVGAMVFFNICSHKIQISITK